MERPAWAPQGIDLNVPSVSRMYDYYLGGSHNFEVDRQAAQQAIAAWPGLPKLVQANRAFMRRAVRFALSEGVEQFLDIGAGIPTFGSSHEVAQAERPGARVVYVDNDPVAVAHSRAVLEGVPGAAVVSADFRTPQDILAAVTERKLLDLDRPVALLMLAVLHFVPDREDPQGILAELGDRLAPGSLLVLSHLAEPPSQSAVQDGGEALLEVYRRTSAGLVLRSQQEFRRFFAGFELVPPGIAPPPRWRPEDGASTADPAMLNGYAGVGRKAGSAG